MAKTYTITISDDDEDVLLSTIVDVQDWLDKALSGKINNVKRKVDTEFRMLLDLDPTVVSIPADINGRLSLIRSRPEYAQKKLDRRT
tara:strand:- start:15 stop:275 length:261 start_codon:yes stop_codon:yes gene_type:complete